MSTLAISMFSHFESWWTTPIPSVRAARPSRRRHGSRELAGPLRYGTGSCQALAERKSAWRCWRSRDLGQGRLPGPARQQRKLSPPGCSVGQGQACEIMSPHCTVRALAGRLLQLATHMAMAAVGRGFGAMDSTMGGGVSMSQQHLRQHDAPVQVPLVHQQRPSETCEEHGRGRESAHPRHSTPLCSRPPSTRMLGSTGGPSVFTRQPHIGHKQLQQRLDRHPTEKVVIRPSTVCSGSHPHRDDESISTPTAAPPSALAWNMGPRDLLPRSTGRWAVSLSATRPRCATRMGEIDGLMSGSDYPHLERTAPRPRIARRCATSWAACPRTTCARHAGRASGVLWLRQPICSQAVAGPRGTNHWGPLRPDWAGGGTPSVGAWPSRRSLAA